MTQSVLLFNCHKPCLSELDAHWSTLCIYVVIPRFEEEPNGITAHSMPPVRRRGLALIQNDTNLLNREVVVAHGL